MVGDLGCDLTRPLGGDTDFRFSRVGDLASDTRSTSLKSLSGDPALRSSLTEALNADPDFGFFSTEDPTGTRGTCFIFVEDLGGDLDFVFTSASLRSVLDLLVIFCVPRSLCSIPFFDPSSLSFALPSLSVFIFGCGDLLFDLGLDFRLRSCLGDRDSRDSGIIAGCSLDISRGLSPETVAAPSFGGVS